MGTGKPIFDETTGEIFIKTTPESGSNHLIFGEEVIPPLFAGWTNVSWTTFASSGINITSAIEATSTKVWAETELVEFTVGDEIQVNYDLTLNSGSYVTNTVEIHLVHEFMGIQGTMTMNPSFPYGNTFTISTLPGSMNFKLRYQNYDKTTGHPSNSSCELVIYKV